MSNLPEHYHLIMFSPSLSGQISISHKMAQVKIFKFENVKGTSVVKNPLIFIALDKYLNPN
jgi:hypothetical protein